MQDNFLQFLGLIKKSGKIAEGYNKCEELIKKNRICLILFSRDASENTKEKFLNYCSKKGIPSIEDYSKEELGYILGKNEIKVLGITDPNLSRKLLEYWKK